MIAYLFPMLAAIVTVIGLASRSETIRKGAVISLAGICAIYLLIEPGAILRAVATTEPSGAEFVRGVVIAGQYLDRVHLWTIGMIIALTLLALIGKRK